MLIQSLSLNGSLFSKIKSVTNNHTALTNNATPRQNAIPIPNSSTCCMVAESQPTSSKPILSHKMNVPSATTNVSNVAICFLNFRMHPTPAAKRAHRVIKLLKHPRQLTSDGFKHS